MSIDQVVKLGEEITKPDLGWFSQFSWPISLLIVGTIIVGIFLIVWGENIYSIFVPILGVISIAIGVIVFIAAIAISYTEEEEIYQAEIDKWKEEVAYPFINSLETEKKRVVHIEIDAELSHEVSGQSVWGNGYTRSVAVEKTPLTVSFQDKGIITRTNWFETTMELTKEVEPFVEFQRLTKDLGHGINADFYNLKVFLPETYKFTEIK